MNRLRISLLTVLVFTGFYTAAIASQVKSAEPLLYRNALIIGSNTGAPERQQLRYAVTDAYSFANVLKSIGGISNTSCIIVENPSAAKVKEALQTLKETAAATNNKNGRREIIFYYSGHADEHGFLLGNEVFEYSTLKAELNSISADVRIAIVDACASGSLTREKGGVKRPPFLYDASSKMEGHAYLTSSSDDESAIESDKIKGSYFTHALVSGLRGAADFNSDGKVTLNEAYQFTFNETLKKTEKTIAGPQHAGYDIRLKGTGDLVMTDLREGSSGLTIAEDITGSIYIRNKMGNLIVEFNKQFSKAITISMDPGIYELTIEQGSDIFVSTVELTDNQLSSVNAQSFKKIEKIAGVQRGGTNSDSLHKEDVSQVPVVFSVFPPLSTAGLNFKTNTVFLLGLFAGETNNLSGCAISSLGNLVRQDSRGVCISGLSNITVKKLQGASISGIAEYCNGGQGLQLSGCVNVIGKEAFTGAQITGTTNVAMHLNGIQLGGVANYSTEINGAQISGVLNVSGQMKYGAQISGVANVIGTQNLKGSQISGVANYLTGTINGAQISGCLNTAKTVNGAQISTINIAKKVSGVQVGVINLAEENEGFTIGLLSFVKKNPPRAQVWVDEMGFANAGIRTGTKNSYSYLGLGMKRSGGQNYWTPLYGLGFRKEFKKTFVGIDFLGKRIHNGMTLRTDYSFYHSIYRGIVGYKIFNHFTLWGGPTINALYTLHDVDFSVPSWSIAYGKHTIVWPGFVAGVEF